jgi:hypothetical protein
VWDNGVTDGDAFEPTTTETYTVTGTDGNNCSNTATITITVNTVPTTTLALTADEICVYSSPLALGGGSPAGGTYSGPGVAGGMLDPEAAGLGVQTITYTFTDGNGCEGSATDNITVDGCLGIDETAQLVLQAYPNPGTGLFTVTSDNAEALTAITVVDLQGKMVPFGFTQQNQNNVLIDLSDAEAGIYFLQASANGSVVTLRLAKQ